MAEVINEIPQTKEEILQIIPESIQSYIDNLYGYELDLEQLYQVALGVKNLGSRDKEGITSLDKVEVYARSDFDAKQMMVIRHSFELNIPFEDVCYFANPDFDAEQMKQISLGFLHGLPLSDIQLYAMPQVDTYHMSKIRTLLENDYPEVEELACYLEVWFNIPLEDALFKIYMDPEDPIVQEALISLQNE